LNNYAAGIHALIVPVSTMARIGPPLMPPKS
jgi:hypothetical protein